MESIENILEEVKYGNKSILEAKNDLIEHILQKPSCEEGHEMKYLQLQDRWYCITCQSFEGYTKNFFKDYERGEGN